VTVIDDGDDSTFDFMKKYLDRPNLIYIKLKEKIGTVSAKNFGILISPYNAITFHDSDDSYDPLKLMMQVRALDSFSGIRDPDSLWNDENIEKNDVAVGRHKFFRLDGKIYEVGRPVSLVDDFFPNIVYTNDITGQFILPNPSLWRRSVNYDDFKIFVFYF